MKIVISYNGEVSRFLNLAKHLYAKRHLYRLYLPDYPIGFPFFNRDKVLEGIDEKNVRTNRAIGFMNRVSGVRGLRNLISNNVKRRLIAELFDTWVSKDLDREADIVDCMSSMALHTLKRAKRLGIIAILNRTNSHIESQTALLNEEYARFGIKNVFNTKEIIERGIEEYEEADYISVLSSYAKKTFLDKKIPENKLLVIPSGIDVTCFRQIKKEDAAFRVIFCGLSSIKKGTHYLLEAFNSLKVDNAELWLIGGAYKDIEKPLNMYSGKYKIINFIPHNELYKYYSQGSVFVLPSLEEGLPKVMMEAMACGLPVIATVNSGAQDVVRDNVDGFIVPARDADSLRDKIRYMYENQEICRHMGQNAKERIRQAFTIEHYAERVIQSYSTILKCRIP